MGRPRYVFTTCSEHFTRKYSAKRHNITVHHNSGGEILPLVEYLVRRSSGKYDASHAWYPRASKRIHNFGRAVVENSVGDAFRTEALQRQQLEQYQERYHRKWHQELSMSRSSATMQYQSPDVMSPYPNDPTFQSMNKTDGENNNSVAGNYTKDCRAQKAAVQICSIL